MRVAEPAVDQYVVLPKATIGPFSFFEYSTIGWSWFEDLANYLGDRAAIGDVDLATVDSALLQVQTLSRQVNLLPMPFAAVGSERQVLIWWEQAGHHLEAEVFPDGHAEFFYENRSQGECMNVDVLQVGEIPVQIQRIARSVFVGGHVDRRGWRIAAGRRAGISIGAGAVRSNVSHAGPRRLHTFVAGQGSSTAFNLGLEYLRDFGLGSEVVHGFAD